MAKNVYKRLDPAYSIIRYLGGPTHVANILGVCRLTIYLYMRARTRGGTGGAFDYEKMLSLLAYAEENEIDLRPNDFFNPTRLHRIMDNSIDLNSRKCFLCKYNCSKPISHRDVSWFINVNRGKGNVSTGKVVDEQSNERGDESRNEQSNEE